VNLPSGQAVAYSYDAFGRRVGRNAGGTTTGFLYDGADVVLDKASDGSSVDYLNGPGIDNKLRQTSAAGVLYFLADHLQSTVALSDGAGNVLERLQYDAFGAGAGSSRTRYDYAGRERDAASGLLYFRARWYDPQQGRFISEDPIGFASGGTNLFVYVGNEPVLLKDPSGLDGDSDFSLRALFSSILKDTTKGAALGCLAGLAAEGVGCGPAAVKGAQAGAIGGAVSYFADLYGKRFYDFCVEKAGEAAIDLRRNLDERKQITTRNFDPFGEEDSPPKHFDNPFGEEESPPKHFDNPFGEEESPPKHFDNPFDDEEEEEGGESPG
jgi:RHS repeat-associated protein